jgi:histidinol-phosphate aminotransferase
VTVPESIVVEPAFDMYAACTDATGGRVATIRPRPDLAFPIDELLAAIGPATRLVFLTSPNNPTGHLIDPEAIDRIAEAARHATVFLDEAYGDFGGTTFIGRRADHPNVLVGRTFAKAYGLAALRIGAVVGDPERLAALRRSVTPYSVNICAMVGLEAALRDREHVERYVSDVRRSRRLLYDACTRWRVQYWESAANFVLVKIGARASEVVRALAGRGIFIRDRSAEPGCDGCVRITTGRVQDTEACIAALDDIIQTEAAPCAAP